MVHRHSPPAAPARRDAGQQRIADQAHRERDAQAEGRFANTRMTPCRLFLPRDRSMHETASSVLSAWSNFSVIAGSCAAALTGSMSVAIALAAAARAARVFATAGVL
jgi:hypothetical protein